jgi:hypothetical protein
LACVSVARRRHRLTIAPPFSFHQRAERELGDKVVSRTDCVFLDDWLNSFCKTADQWNKWRHTLVLLSEYAVSKKFADSNEAEKLLERSTSKKLEINRKVRRQLDIQGFNDIHEHAPKFLQIAMEQSLVTLQARTEICNVQHAHYRNGHLFVIRDKTSGDSEMAFIKIARTEELEDIRRRSLRLDGIAFPYLIHRAPDPLTCRGRPVRLSRNTDKCCRCSLIPGLCVPSFWTGSLFPGLYRTSGLDNPDADPGGRHVVLMRLRCFRAIGRTGAPGLLARLCKKVASAATT